MMTVLKPLSVPLLGAALLVSPAEAQDLSITSLSQPEGKSERGFTQLVGVKELRDGRVILLDEREVSVVLLDRDLGGERTIGRTGSGPGEYRSPSGLFSLAGDSSAVLDYGNGRLLLLGADAEPCGVLNLTEVPSSSPARPFGGDDRGRIYLTSGAGDSRIVMRWDPQSRVLDTVASLRPSAAPDSPNIMMVSGGFNPFGPTRAFAVGPTGTIAIVHPEPYRVEWITADGIRREGPTVPVDPVEVTEGHKEQWLDSRARPVTRMGVARGSNAPVRSTVRPRYPEPSWPRYLPPFLSQYAATFTPEGRLWVERTTPVGDPPTFDVFDGAGSRVRQIELPPGRRLLGFGRGTVYAVVRDEMDLEYLERYRLAGFGEGR